MLQEIMFGMNSLVGENFLEHCPVFRYLEVQIRNNPQCEQVQRQVLQCPLSQRICHTGSFEGMLVPIKREEISAGSNSHVHFLQLFFLQ